MRWTVTSVFRLIYLLIHELKYKSSKLFHIDSFLRSCIYILSLRLESTYEILMITNVKVQLQLSIQKYKR